MSAYGDPPPLHMLETLSTVARLRSFSLAAAALGITQSAVSQRIAGLEGRFGVRLLIRSGGNVTLTREGKEYLASIEDALLSLRKARANLTGTRRTVRISTFPSFARCWLVPRLPMLADAFPGVAVSIHTSDRKVVVDEGEFDLALRLCPSSDRSGEPVGQEEDSLIAVVNRKAAKKAGSADPFEQTTLLEDECTALGVEAGQSWAAWYRLNARSRSDARPMITFNDASLMVEAAVSGLGVALAREMFVADALKTGSLVAEGIGLRVPNRTVLLQRPRSRRSKLADKVCRAILNTAQDPALSSG